MARRSGRAAVESLLEQLDEAYDRQSWHGTNLRGSLRGLTVDQALWRPAPGRPGSRCYPTVRVVAARGPVRSRGEAFGLRPGRTTAGLGQSHGRRPETSHGGHTAGPGWPAAGAPDRAAERREWERRAATSRRGSAAAPGFATRGSR